MIRNLIHISLIFKQFIIINQTKKKIFVFRESPTILDVSKRYKLQGLPSEILFSLAEVTTTFKVKSGNYERISQLAGSQYTEIKEFSFILLEQGQYMLLDKDFIYTVQTKEKKNNFQFSEPEFSCYCDRALYSSLTSKLFNSLYKSGKNSCYLNRKHVEVRFGIGENYQIEDEDDMALVSEYIVDHDYPTKQILNVRNLLTLQKFETPVTIINNDLQHKKIEIITQKTKRNKSLESGLQSENPKVYSSFLTSEKFNLSIQTMKFTFDQNFPEIVDKGKNIETSELTTNKSSFITEIIISIRHDSDCIEYNESLEKDPHYEFEKTKELVKLTLENRNAQLSLETFFKKERLEKLYKTPLLIECPYGTGGKTLKIFFGVLLSIFGVLLSLGFFFNKKVEKERGKKSRQFYSENRKATKESSSKDSKSKRVFGCFGKQYGHKEEVKGQAKNEEPRETSKSKDVYSDIKMLIDFLEHHLEKKKIEYDRNPRTFWRDSQNDFYSEEGKSDTKIRENREGAFIREEYGSTVRMADSGPFFIYEPPAKKAPCVEHNIYSLLKQFLNEGKADLFGFDFDLTYYFETCNGLKAIIIEMIMFITEDYPSEKCRGLDVVPDVKSSQARGELLTCLENFYDHLWAKEFRFIEKDVYSADKDRRRLACFMTDANLALMNSLEAEYGLRKPRIYLEFSQWFKRLQKTVKL